MSLQRESQPFRKKYAHEACQEGSWGKPDPFETPSRYNTIDSKHTDQDILNANFSIQSSRIAEETAQVSPTHFEQLLRQKMEQLEEETEKLLLKKDREVYFMQVEIRNQETRLTQAHALAEAQRKEIDQLRVQVQQLRTESSLLAQDNLQLQETLKVVSGENSQLKASLDLLIAEKNESLKLAHRREFQSVQSNLGSQQLKREVEDLRVMVAEMELSVKNCSSCFSLRRENQELTEAYDHLKAMYSQLSQQKDRHEKDLLQNITAKIQENQNIIRENLQLKERSGSAIKAARQKLKESVAKRCRTLTDQF